MSRKVTGSLILLRTTATPTTGSIPIEELIAANGHMTDEELDEALAELEETRTTAKRELEALAGQRERLEQLEREKDVLLETYAALAPEALESLDPEERHRIYKMLRLRVIAG